MTKILKEKIRTALLIAMLIALAAGLGACGEATPLTSYERGMAALRSGDRTAASNYFETSTRTEGEKALGHRGLGIIYLERGDNDKAIQEFRGSIEAVGRPRLNKSFVEDTQLYLAKAYVENKEPDKAMTVYSSLLSGDRTGEAYLLRGKLYAADGKFGQAAQDFQRAIEMDSSYEVYLQIYDVYAGLNRQADGAVFLREAQAGSSDSKEDAYQLGRISFFLGDHDSAKENLTKAANGGVPGAAALLGRVYMEEGDLSGAITVFRKCIENGSDTAAGYNGLALCAMESGDYDEALRNIRAGLTNGDKEISEQLLFNEIVVYERKHDFVTALSKMEAFIATYPANEEAQREYVFLQSRIQEMESEPEDISNALWEFLVAKWEAEAEQEQQSVPEETYEEETY